MDDNEDLRNSLMDYFETKGFEVNAIEDGQMVGIECQRRIPDLIISDIRMPGLDGVSLMKELQRRDETKTIPIIFMSAYYDDDVMIAAKKLGAEDFILKPFQADRLEKMINRTIGEGSV